MLYQKGRQGLKWKIVISMSLLARWDSWQEGQRTRNAKQLEERLKNVR